MAQTSSRVARAEFVPLPNGVRGFYALPSGSGPFPAVLVYQEAFGVNAYIQSEAVRLAEHGFAALAPDLFHGETFEHSDMERVYARLKTLTDDGLLNDVDAAIAFLRSRDEIVAFLTATARAEAIGAAISFYGGNIAPSEQKLFPPLLHHVPELRGELWMLYGADDAGIAPDEHARLCEALSREKKSYAIRVFQGAGHGFASRGRESYRPEPTRIAWDETLAVLDRVLRARSA